MILIRLLNVLLRMLGAEMLTFSVRMDCVPIDFEVLRICNFNLQGACVVSVALHELFCQIG